MNPNTTHRLDGLEPDNLLAFLALLGLLRTLEEAHPAWRPRIAWTVDAPPVRPVLKLSDALTKEAVVSATASGLTRLALRHEFEPFRDVKLSPEEASEKLRAAARSDRYTADLWAALASDAAVRERNKAAEVEPTPLCLLFGQGHQHFLERLSAVPREATPPPRRLNRRKSSVTEAECLTEALFAPWTRPDATHSFRWDPHEDVRYALRATDPTDSKTKETTQHGANRLAAVGLSVLTVIPRRRGGDTRLDVLGGSRDSRRKLSSSLGQSGESRSASPRSAPFLAIQVLATLSHERRSASSICGGAADLIREVHELHQSRIRFIRKLAA